MNKQVALISEESQLSAALQATGHHVVACPAQSARDALRWTMELSPHTISLCIIAESETLRLQPIETALDPAIPLICWVPPTSHGTFSPQPGSRALTSFAAHAQEFANQIATLATITGHIQPRPLSAPPQSPSTAAPATTHDDTEEDRELLRKLEEEMMAPVKTITRAEPVTIQAPAVDFSIPLRELMSRGKSIAEQHHNPEVFGIHYLAALNEPFLSAFRQVGLNPDHVQDYINSLESETTANATEPVISDEVFQAVSEAKKTVRQREGAYVKVGDFLRGLLAIAGSSLVHFAEQHGLALDALLSATTRFDNIAENPQQSFFEPSSLDQAHFYQFDNAHLKDVETRLKDLPAFQKASRPVSSSPHKKTATSPSAAYLREAAPPPDKPDLLRAHADFPSVDTIEQVVDQLLEGQVIAFANDVMLALAADAANPGAVERLREISGRPADQPLSLLVNSTSQLKHLVRADLDALEPLLDELWPGPLTLIFNAAPGLGRHLVRNGTIALRQPADNTSLALLSMLGRPLAITSWDEPGGIASAISKLQGQLALALDNGETPASVTTTVADLTQSPWKILRQGAVAAPSILEFQSTNQ